MKRLVAVRRDPAVDPEEFARQLLAEGAALAPAGATAQRIDVLAPDGQELLARRGFRVEGPPPWDGLSWTWGGRDLPDPPSWVAGAAAYDLDEHPAWDYERDWPDGEPTPGIKQVSWVTSPEGLGTAEFRRHYREHVPVAHEHHAGCWKYVQNDVAVAHPGTPHADGFSELWFRSVDDFLERFYTTDESPATVRDDTTEFIDYRRTFSLLVVEHIQP